jgi:hypothetical protein
VRAEIRNSNIEIRIAALILRITPAAVAGPTSLRLTFNNGEERTVNVTPLLNGAIFEPLRNPQFFAQVRLDPVCGAVVWPNGADFAPEALHALSNNGMHASAQSLTRTAIRRV